MHWPIACTLNDNFPNITILRINLGKSHHAAVPSPQNPTISAPPEIGTIFAFAEFRMQGGFNRVQRGRKTRANAP